jgi:hypothetical protein
MLSTTSWLGLGCVKCLHTHTHTHMSVWFVLPFVSAEPKPSLPPDPCIPPPCGENAQCTSRDGTARCTCIPPYKGNPYVNCQPECVISSDCPSHLACVAQNCRDPCQGVCGINAACNVVNHIPLCSCLQGFMGDPFKSCRQEPPRRKYLMFYYFLLRVCFIQYEEFHIVLH